MVGKTFIRAPQELLKEGENTLEVSYTTTLANYTHSSTSNEVAQQWTNLQEPEPMGLSNDVRLLKSRGTHENGGER